MGNLLSRPSWAWGAARPGDQMSLMVAGVDMVLAVNCRQGHEARLGLTSIVEQPCRLNRIINAACHNMSGLWP